LRTVEIVLFLVVLATLVATFAQRLGVPAPSLLVIAGLAVALIPGVPTVRATPDLVSLVVLPPLLYAAGEQVAWHQVRLAWRPVSALAVGLVVASAAAVAAVTAAVTIIPPATAFVLGAVLASTDPVAVTALGRRLGLPSRLQAIVSAESLFNDATSLVLFRVTVGVVVGGGSVAWGSVALQFLRLAGGGVLIGAVLAAGVAMLRSRIHDPVLDTVTALVAPYLVYVVAEVAHTSGVTAVVIASMVAGTRAARRSAPRHRLQVDAVYDTVIFVLESVVFALVGLQLPVLIGDLPGAQGAWPLAATTVALALIAVRVAWVFPLAAVTRGRAGGGLRSWQAPAVVSWAGARGVVPLAAALSIPLTVTGGSPFPDRPLVVVIATVVIAATLVVQGLSLQPLVRRAGLQANARAGRGEEGPAAGAEAEAAYRHQRRRLIAVESDELDRLYRQGEIDDATRRRLQWALDLEDGGLDDRP
jgi:CPA1 family monovalent cation:H+ antiporter